MLDAVEHFSGVQVFCESSTSLGAKRYPLGSIFVPLGSILMPVWPAESPILALVVLKKVYKWLGPINGDLEYCSASSHGQNIKSLTSPWSQVPTENQVPGARWHHFGSLNDPPRSILDPPRSILDPPRSSLDPPRSIFVSPWLRWSDFWRHLASHYMVCGPSCGHFAHLQSHYG